MKPKLSYSLFAFQDCSTGEFLTFGTKAAWVSTGAAKNAFNLHMKTKYVGQFGNKERSWEYVDYFSKQQDYELVELTKYCGVVIE